ncbi:MAG: hypothetical protein IJC48_09155 [Clostridia bacterium]|nr:hypothetical protein [Clostridia bacterium]
MLRRMLSVILTAALILSCAVTAHASVLSKKERYDAALDELAAYVKYEREDIDLVGLSDNFLSLRDYESSSNFYRYTLILIRLEEGAFSDEKENPDFNAMLDEQIPIFLMIMDMDKKFTGFLEEDGRFGTVGDLTNYYNGRIAEENDDPGTACDYYACAISFMDSSTRYTHLSILLTAEKIRTGKALLEEKKYDEAYEIFSELAEQGFVLEKELKEAESNKTKVHVWVSATCTTPETCSVCGETRGEALGHNFSNATCTEPSVCVSCGYAGGSALGHDYADATCTTPATCVRCNQTTGSSRGHVYSEADCTSPATCIYCGAAGASKLGHDYKQATCTDPAVCSVCGQISGTALGHNYTSATCTEAKTCTRCEQTSGAALGHNYTSATCTEAKTCTRCGQTSGTALGHNYASATCTDARICTRCGQTNGSALGHIYASATCTEAKTCLRCGKTDGSALGHDYDSATCTSAKTCTRCGQTSGSKLGHDYTSATCVTPATCRRCGAVSGGKADHRWKDATYTSPKTCIVCGTTTGTVLYRPISYCGGLVAEVSSYRKNNIPDASAKGLLDGNWQKREWNNTWDSDNRNIGQYFILRTADGSEYEVNGLKIVNGKHDQKYFERNCRIKTLSVYVDGVYCGDIRVSDFRGTEQYINFGPVSGSVFKFVVKDVYYGTKYNDVCVAEAGLY